MIIIIIIIWSIGWVYFSRKMNSEQILQNPYQPLLRGDRIFSELCPRVSCHLATLCHCKLLLLIEMHIKEFGCTATACIEHRPFVQSSNQVFSEWDPTALRVNCVAIHLFYWRPLVWMGFCCYTSTVGWANHQHTIYICFFAGKV